jgi:hypothetical protein
VARFAEAPAGNLVFIGGTNELPQKEAEVLQLRLVLEKTSASWFREARRRPRALPEALKLLIPYYFLEAKIAGCGKTPNPLHIWQRFRYTE